MGIGIGTIVTIIVAVVSATWVLLNKINSVEKRVIDGQNKNKLYIQKGLTRLKEYVDKKMVNLEKRVANLEGRAGVKTPDNGHDELFEVFPDNIKEEIENGKK